MAENILYGLTHIFTWQNMLFIFLGIFVGLFVGGLPGLSVTLAVALMIPFTFGLPPESAILLLLGVYCAGTYAGSVGAVLLRTPGTPASAATAVDGFALSQKGEAGKALNVSLIASVTGGLISGILLLFAAPQIAKFALNFGPPEYFALALFGLTIIASVSGKSFNKGLVMASLGVFIASIGLDPLAGSQRLTFGSSALLSGVNIIPALIGLFAIAEVFRQVEKGMKKISTPSKVDNEKIGWRFLRPYKRVIFKSSLIGSFIGSIPGTGGAIASFISYNEAKRTSKNPEQYGKGSLEGVAASEASNNGTTGATLIPMMTLGIPGDVVTAVLLSSLLIQGLQPGPELFEQHGGMVYTVMIGFIVVNICMYIVAKLSIRGFKRITLVPSSILFPIILVFCLVGSFAYDNSMTAVWIAVAFGFIGYILPKFGYPVVPMLIAIILGPLAETSLRQSLIMSEGSLVIFTERPVAVVFLLLAVLSVFVALYNHRKTRLSVH
ncbi:putative tricarboxylic transport membrane protein [Alteribacillus persepolensis]|uniref:Putative tricarboxylic transport membrane protein n=1 Tax=Alteribacillus persepolensis TaxID=568899 RepID=A0A1G8A7Q6_9BACI|nr:tripartite tricarboxylate transporter permease [Alteribacillus persepolensis]SDH16913.1 putative tricarboxylic transport membrane protein [Alteribacillus persepolensis]